MCRYDWMRECLDTFSELIVKESAVSKDADTDNSDGGFLSNVVKGCTIVPLKCRASPSVSHHSSPREFLGSVGLESSSLFRSFF